MKHPKLVILTEQSDKSADMVCQWLYHWDYDFLRFNEDKSVNPVVKVSFENGENTTTLRVHGEEFLLTGIPKTWFRRGFVKCMSLGNVPNLQSKTNKSIERHLENEGKTLEEFLYFILGQSQGINHPNCYNYNKLIALFEAQKIGFHIPPTLLSVNAQYLKQFVEKQGACISKSIQDLMGIAVNDLYAYTGKTVRVNADDIHPQGHWYSLFQREITKKYEIRVFYFLRKIYAMAIFSQLDKDSILDFREVDVNGSHPNRMVPFVLPNHITQKVRKLMKMLKLESGSLDFIVTPDNEYYFLEVNPVGQFNFVSEICNYHIEKHIAKTLSS